MDLIFKEQLPKAIEYNYLRQKVGWGEYGIEVIEKALPNSLYSVCVFDDDQIIGMGRVIGDHGLCFYIQDIIVLPDYQGKSIGKNIMIRVMQYIELNSSNNSIIGLMSAFGKEEFYEKFGFTKRPNEKLGCGMTLFVKKIRARSKDAI